VWELPRKIACPGHTEGAAATTKFPRPVVVPAPGFVLEGPFSLSHRIRQQ